MKYVLVTAAKNEENYIEKPLEAVVNQTIKPMEWVIVSDNSNDKTETIVEDYIKDYPFIRLLRRSNGDPRNFGSQIDSINLGIRDIHCPDYEFIGNIDADISFDKNYYEAIFSKFKENKRLGLAGGFFFELHGKKFVKRGYSKHSVPHGVQIFRRRAFETIGGYREMKYGGADSVAEVMVRMEGWEVRSFKDILIYHHRPTLTAGNILGGAFRQGLMDHSVGNHPVFEVSKMARIIFYRPYIIYSLSRGFGFITGYIKRERRRMDKNFINYLRKEQLCRLAKCFNFVKSDN